MLFAAARKLHTLLLWDSSHLLKRGCLFCSLRTCVLIQGWLYSIISTLVALPVALMALTVLHFLYKRYISGPPTKERWNLWLEETVQFSLIVVIGLLCVLTEYAMLIGVYKRKAWMLVPHLFLTVIVTVSVTMTAVSLSSGYFVTKTVPYVGLFVCTQGIFWFHVFSYYHKLKARKIVHPVALV